MFANRFINYILKLIFKIIIFMQELFDVIIIGAGVSGIGASLQLSKHSIRHLIVEGRDRIGGRILPKAFDGVEIQLGASYVHLPNQKNRFLKIIKQKQYKCNFAEFQSYQFIYEGKGQVSKKTAEKGFTYLQQLIQQIKTKADNSNADLSLQEAAKDFFAKIQSTTNQQIRNIIKWDLNILGNIEGAEIHQISAKQYQETQSSQDLVPVKGYSQILKDLFKQCKAQIRFNQTVTKIDYSKQIIKVVTKDNIFFAKKLISSIPLGVLKSNTVQFIPKLPEKQIMALNNIGNGIANKLFVSFQQPFWNIQTKWLYFVKKGNNNRYPAAVSIIEESKYILCFFVSGDASKQISQMTEEEILSDLVIFLGKFNFTKQIKVRAIEVTKWHEDPFSLGSYAYYKVGTKVEDVDVLRQPIDNKIWFVGEHCNPQTLSCVHSAFETGILAAEELRNKQK